MMQNPSTITPMQDVTILNMKVFVFHSFFQRKKTAVSPIKRDKETAIANAIGFKLQTKNTINNITSNKIIPSQ